MLRVVFLCAVATVAVSIPDFLADPRPANNRSALVPLYTVDLDAPASQRWQALATQYKPQITAVVDIVKQRIPKIILPLLEKMGGKLEEHLPAPYAEEIASVAAATGQPVADIFALNIFYEINSGCTSIVAAQQNGTLIHGRNLDYGIPGLQNLTADVVFTRGGGAEVYRGTTYIGYVGLLTGMRPHAWSVSIDERDTTNGTVWDNAMEALLHGGHSIGFFLRSTLETAEDFDTALSAVQAAPLDSPSYIILGGAGGDGAIVTRERSVAVDTWRLDRAGGRWFIVQTNDDHWSPPKDIRRGAANDHMNLTTPAALNSDFMWEVMSAYPTQNSGTTYTTVMSPDTLFYRTVTRND